MLINFSSSQTVKIQTKVSRYTFSKCNQATVNIDLPFERRKRDKRQKKSSEESMDQSGSNPPNQDASRENHKKKKKNKKSRPDSEVNDQQDQGMTTSASGEREKRKERHKGKENMEGSEGQTIASNENGMDEKAGKQKRKRKSTMDAPDQEIHISKTEETNPVSAHVNQKKKRKYDGQKDDGTCQKNEESIDTQTATLDLDVSSEEKKTKKERKRAKYRKATEESSDPNIEAAPAEDTAQDLLKTKKRSKKLQTEVDITDSKTGIDVSVGEKKKKKQKHKRSCEESSNLIRETTPEGTPRQKKKKRDEKLEGGTEVNVSQEDGEIDRANVDKSKRKRKLEASTTETENVKSSITELTSKNKKIKKGKHKSPEDSSLGVVDQSILQQAGTNLGLPVEEQDSAPANAPKEKRKKKDKATESGQEKNTTQQEGTRWNRCLDYLRLFASNRNSWRFKKASQVQLLQIMYNKSQMSDEDFDLMLLYLEEIKGKGRNKTREDAEKLLQEDRDTQEAEDPDKIERARQVFQLLS